VPFEPSLREHFYTLNAAWLKKHFVIEPIDEQVLRDPEQLVLAPGGAIFFARLGDAIIGTCALLHEAPAFMNFPRWVWMKRSADWAPVASCWTRRSPNFIGVAATPCSSNPTAV
jgi:hypothetical protein